MPPHTLRLRWLDCEAPQDHLLHLLDPAERTRAAAFRFAPDRNSFIAAHALTRLMLTEAGDRPPQAWRFHPGPHGKPEIDPPHSLRFNLSHTRGMAACGVMLETELGVDVEATARPHDTLALAHRFFTPGEAEAIQHAPDKQDAFLRHWTLKEAVMKATGEGFRLPLDSFAVTLAPPGVRFMAGPRGEWTFHQIRLGTHILAAAARSADVAIDAAPFRQTESL